LIANWQVDLAVDLVCSENKDAVSDINDEWSLESSDLEWNGLTRDSDPNKADRDSGSEDIPEELQCEHASHAK